MNPADRERAKELLAEAAELKPARRQAFIQSAHASDEAKVEAIALLAAMGDSAFMGAPTGAGFASVAASPPTFTEAPGSRIGRYKLLQSIGEGGFGTVFMADQIEPVHRRVALKIIKAGMDTRQVIARFEAERQALALMDHPNIARVLDAGTTDRGRPFFVMELVRGDPVTHYCDQERLLVRQRLELFGDICNAVEHAHQKGIIHRDLKPSNVLVTVADGKPLPKVIDFGIAKTTVAPLTDKTLFTEMHQLIGTPEYMSPEQAEVAGIDIDTRSDIYSLGVLLYELLTGSTPLERNRLRSTPLAEVQRLIREEEPPRPSYRFATIASTPNAVTPLAVNDSSAIDIAHRRQCEPAMLTRVLRGDLDWIVMKCLEKDRARRYPTASALAEDIRRYLMEQPVFATPAGRGYQLRKFVRRNRTAVWAGGGIAVAMILGIVGTTIGLVSAIRERRQTQQQKTIAEENAELARREATRANKEAEQVRAVADFQAQVLSEIDPQAMGVRLRADLLAKARDAAQNAGRSGSEIETRTKDLESLLVGIDLTGLALSTLDQNVFDQTAAAIESQFSDQPLLNAQLLESLGCTLRKLGLLEAANDPHERVLSIRRQFLGDDHLDTLKAIGNLGELRLAQGKLDEAEEYILEAVQGLRRLAGNEHALTLTATNNLADLFLGQGKLVEAEALFRESIDGFRRVQGDEHPETLTSIANLGIMLLEQSRFDEAEPYLQEALSTRRRVLGEENSDTLVSIHQMGLLVNAQGKSEEAEAYFRESMEKHRAVLGDDHPNTLSAIMTMGLMLRSQGRLEEVEPFYLEALGKQRRLLGDDHPSTLTTIHNLGFLLQAQGKYGAAEPYCREAMETWRRQLGDEHPDSLIAINNMGVVLLAQGRLAEAEPFCREALVGRRRIRGETHFDTLVSATNMGNLLVAQRKSDEALEIMVPLEEAARQTFTAGNAVRLGKFLTPLGRARSSVGDFDLAESNLTEAESILSNARGVTKKERADVLSGLVELYDAWHVVQAEAGHDAIAAQWRHRLSESLTNP